MNTRFRLLLTCRKRSLRLTPVPRIRVIIGTKYGCTDILFGSYGKLARPEQYDEKGNYIKGQPWSPWMYGTLYYADDSPIQRSKNIKQFWNYVRKNVKNIHPADYAKN